MRRPGIRTAPVRKAIEKTLIGEKRDDAEVSVLLAGDARIRKLNREYRGIDSATDVLAFAMGDGEFADLHPQLLGDVIISVDTAEKQAEKAGRGLLEELKLLAIHGTLHLLGYDDETSADRALMRRRERKYLKTPPASTGKGK